MNSSIQGVARSNLVAAAAAAVTASAALAGPTWDVDYTDDAKQTALDAQIISHPLQPYINIYGHLTGSALVGNGDYVDMYQIQILSQTLVSISTAGGALGGSADFDSQLFIFKRKGGSGNNVRAVAMRGNNDAAPGILGSRIGDELDSNSQYTLLAPGFYYLAITGLGMDAIADNGQLIWPDLGGAGDTVGGNDSYLHDWAGQGATGDYHIRLHALGSNAAPAPGALGLLGLAGLVGRRRR